MKNNVKFRSEQELRRGHFCQRALCLVLLLAMMAGLFPWTTVATAFAAEEEPVCGMEEHEHTLEAGCYEYTLTCELPETDGHVHDDPCYDWGLVCAIPEHVHTDACYAEEESADPTAVPADEEEPSSVDTTADASGNVGETGSPDETGGTGNTESQGNSGGQINATEASVPADDTVTTGEEESYTLPTEDELTGIWREDVVLIAESQVGCQDSGSYCLPDDDGSVTENGYAANDKLSGASDTWDAVFAIFCLYSAGVPEEDFPYENDMEDWIAALTELELYGPAADYAPLPGDLVFLDTEEDGGADTVAIFAGLDEETGDLLLIQGDSHDAVEKYALAPEDESILGYGILPDQDEDNEEDGNAGESGAEEIDYEPAESEDEPEEIAAEADEETPGTSEDGENSASDELTEDTSASGELEEDASEEMASEEPDVVVYMAEDGGISVSVEVPAGALPEGAELALTLYEEDSPEYIQALARMEEAEADDGAAESYETSEEDFQTAVLFVSSPEEEEDALEAEEESSFSFSFGSEEDIESGMAAMDISFLLDGEEVEPSAPAEVTMDASGLLDGQDVLSLEVWHLEESEDGTEPVLVAEVSDADEAELGVAEFTVESFSEFEFHYTCSAGGWAGFGVNLIDKNGNTISATVSSDYTITSGRYTTTVDMPYTFSMEDFVKIFKMNGTYTLVYATVTDPNYGDEDHTFDVWPNEEEVGANELYGSEENPVVSITINGTAAAENPNYGSGTINSKTWHFTLSYKDGTSVTIPIYGNADGANDSGGKYCPKYLEINLYFEADREIVLNLGNGNGTYSDGDYTGSNASGGSALRYGTGRLNDYADEDGKVTINLPSDDDLNNTFTVMGAVGTEGEKDYLPAIEIGLGEEQAYDYKLIGWINIATGKYYDVSESSTTAEVYLSDDNVFYADWIAADYDQGHSTDGNLRDDTISTADFVTIQMFDYNELFDLYSLTLEQNGTDSEEWTDSGYLCSEPILSNEVVAFSTLNPIGNSFIFQNNGTTRTNVHVISHANPAKWNLWTANAAWADDEEYNFVLDAEKYWNITEPDSTILGMLYDTDEKSLGVHYVGDADYLFWIDNDGYYTYDSAVSGAAYNQTDERFYVYEDNANAFFPYNGHTQEISSSNGFTNYWFGMCMEVKFYLPTATSEGTTEDPVNLASYSKDMVFDFSGDDDILVFIDDELVVDMSGIHSTSYSRIDFSTNTVTYSMGLDKDGAPDISGDNGKYYVDTNLNLSAGQHTLQVYYMERGASASNLKIQFNLISEWEYESGSVQTVTAEKVWEDSSGNVIEDTSILKEKCDIDGVEVGLFDALGPRVEEEKDSEGNVTIDGVFGYTKSESDNGTTYTVTYEDDSDIVHQYIYTAASSGGEGEGNSATLVHNQGNYDETGTLVVTASETYPTADEDGKVLDTDGYVIAWLDDEEILHIRVDTESLNENNGWSYTWELLDADGDYEVLELTQSDRYTTKLAKEDLDYYLYWSIIGDAEIEESFKDENTKPLQVILTEAAQEATISLGDTDDALGWVIVLQDDGATLKTEQVEFSQIASLDLIKATDTEVNQGRNYWLSTCGVTTQSAIEALGDGAIWYVRDAKHENADVTGGEVEGFYLYCILNDTTYYLTLNSKEDPDNEGKFNYSLGVTEDPAAKSEFFYDSLGELMIRIYYEEEEDEEEKDNGEDKEEKIDRVRVEISTEGKISIGSGETFADTDDVRIYTLKETKTTGFSLTITNILQPIILQKVDADSESPLSGVEFTLQIYCPCADGEGENDGDDSAMEEAINKDGWYYTGLNSDTEEAVWSSVKYVHTTKDISETGRTDGGATYSIVYQGAIKFEALPDGTYLLAEVSPLPGYNRLPSAIIITVKDGKIVCADWKEENVRSKYVNAISVSEDGFTLTVENYPGASLPNTGDGGILRFIAVGLGAVVIAGSVLTYRHVKTVRWRKSHVRGRG